MSKLTGRLQDASRSGVYRTRAPDALEEAVRGTKLSVARAALEGVQSREALLDALAGALGFPDWFGRNWDALEDCLTDLSWREGEGNVLVLTSFDAVPGDDLGILIDVLSSCAGFWSARGKPFFAVFVDPRSVLALAALHRERD
jgi:hypothetical protein